MTVNPHKTRRAQLISRPSLFAFGLTLLLVVVAMLLVMRRTRPEVDGIKPEISVIHVQGNIAGRRQLGVFAFRDNAYIKADEHVGFLSLASSCSQSAKLPLAESLSVELAKKLVGAERLRHAYGEASGGDSWHIRVQDGQTQRCYAISNDDARANVEVAAVVKWFEAVRNDGIPLNVSSCGGDPDYVYRLCETRQ
jgi:hypothetical protein